MNLQHRSQEGKKLVAIGRRLCLFLTCFVVLACEEESAPVKSNEISTLRNQLIRPSRDFSVEEIQSDCVRFSWIDESIGEAGYRLERRVDDGVFDSAAFAPANTDSLTYRFSLDSTKEYSFRLTTVREDVESEPTRIVSVSFENAYFVSTVRYTGFSYEGQVIRASPTGSSILAAASLQRAPFNDVAVWGTKVVVVGSFLDIGGVDAKHIAFWEAERWNAFATGIDHTLPSRIAIANDAAYVGTYYGPSEPSKLYRWNGTAFSGYEPFSTAILGNVTEVATSGTDVFFCYGSAVTYTPFTMRIAITAIRGSAILPVPQPDIVDLQYHQRNAVAALNGDVYLALVHNLLINDPRPDTTLIRYDGTSWSVADVSGITRYLSSVASWNGQLYGTYNDVDSAGAPGYSVFARWEGMEWVEVRRMDASQIWEVPDGLIVNSYPEGSATATLQHWDGAAWSVFLEFPSDVGITGVALRRGWIWKL